MSSAVAVDQNIKVSVIIAAFNAAKTITRAIDSLKQQSYPNWEAVIINDCSTDNTLETANRLAAEDVRIKVITQKQNMGPAAARNAGFKHAEGDWVTVLDSDDQYLPDRLLNLLDSARQNNLDLVFDNMTRLAAGDVHVPYWPNWKDKSCLITLDEMLKNCAGLGRKPYGILKPFVRKETLTGNGIKYDETLRMGEDVLLHIELMLNGARTGRSANIGYMYEEPEYSADANQHKHNVHDRYRATVKLLELGRGKLTVRQKFWLYVRRKNTTEKHFRSVLFLKKFREQKAYLKIVGLLCAQPWLLIRTVLVLYVKMSNRF